MRVCRVWPRLEHDFEVLWDLNGGRRLQALLTATHSRRHHTLWHHALWHHTTVWGLAGVRAHLVTESSVVAEVERVPVVHPEA